MAKVLEKQIMVLGKEVKVKNWIPYREKVDAAQEWTATGWIFDEELGVAYQTYLYMAIGRYIMLKYYTDMDMSAYDGVDGLYQMMDDMDDETIAEIKDMTMDDMQTVSELAEDIGWSAENAFTEEHSLRRKVMTSFGFLFDGKDITQTLAEARGVNEEMIEHLGKIADANKPIDMAKYAKKKK